MVEHENHLFKCRQKEIDRSKSDNVQAFAGR